MPPSPRFRVAPLIDTPAHAIDDSCIAAQITLGFQSPGKQLRERGRGIALPIWEPTKDAYLVVRTHPPGPLRREKETINEVLDR